MRLAILVALALTGCVPPSVIMRGPSGDLRECSPNPGAMMVWGYAGAESSVERCREAWERVGYRVATAP